eukprot:31412-Pelagococcus_subviridis.AAC.8
MEGMKTPPGTAVPNAATIMSRYVANVAPNPRGDSSSSRPGPPPIESIHPIASFGEENIAVATSLTWPSSHANRTPKPPSRHPSGAATHAPKNFDAANRADTVAIVARTHSSSRSPLLPPSSRGRTRVRTPWSELNATPAAPVKAAVTTNSGSCLELKGVRSGVERRRGVSGLKARRGRRETTAGR